MKKIKKKILIDYTSLNSRFNVVFFFEKSFLR